MQSELTITHVERTREVDSGCLIVEIDELKILVNFGTDQDLSLSIYPSIDQLHGVTHVLLCSSDLASTGGLVHLAQLGITAPIIGTVPIKILGRIEVLERVQVLREFHRQDQLGAGAEAAFDRIIPLKYLQRYDLSEQISVGPLNSGSSLGGAIWKIQKGDQEWLICDRVNHRKEAHLDGIDLLNLGQPAGMAINASAVKRPKHTRKSRDALLIKTVTGTLKRKGKVFIPVSFSQLLEMVMVIHSHPETAAVPMVLYSFHGKKYIDTVKTILEWMGSSVLQKFNQEKENPFNLLKLSFGHECPLAKIEAPIVFVIDKYGNSGFSPVILPLIAGNEENTIVETSPHHQYAVPVRLAPVKYTKLSEPEIQQQHRESRAEQERQATAQKIENLVKQKIDDSSEEEEDREHIISKFWYEVQNETATNEPAMSYLDYEFGGPRKEVTFPVPARRKPSDDYGEQIFISKEKEEEVQAVELQAAAVKQPMYKISVKGKQTIGIQAQIATVHFTGECDIFNLRAMLTGVSAEKLLVYGENPSHRKILFHYLRATAASPEVLELTDQQELVTVRHTQPIKIQAELLSSIQMQQFGSGLIGYFRGKIVPGEKTNMLSLAEAEANAAPATVCLSSIKLRDLRRTFVEAKIKSEVVGNKLIVNDNIFIYLEDAYLKIEGELSKEFYQVKRVLFNSVAFLTTF